MPPSHATLAPGLSITVASACDVVNFRAVTLCPVTVNCFAERQRSLGLLANIATVFLVNKFLQQVRMQNVIKSATC